MKLASLTSGITLQLMILHIIPSDFDLTVKALRVLLVWLIKIKIYIPESTVAKMNNLANGKLQIAKWIWNVKFCEILLQVWEMWSVTSQRYHSFKSGRKSQTLLKALESRWSILLSYTVADTRFYCPVKFSRGQLWGEGWLRMVGPYGTVRISLKSGSYWMLGHRVTKTYCRPFILGI